MDSFRRQIITHITDFLATTPVQIGEDQYLEFNAPDNGAEGRGRAEAQRALVLHTELGTTVVPCSIRSCPIEKCPRCLECSRDKVALWRHVRQTHGDDQRLNCPAPGCGRRFSAVYTVAAHRSHHTTCSGPVPYTCEFCGRLSPDPAAFSDHVAREHRDALDGMCGVCWLFTGDVRSLEKHLGAAHGVPVRPQPTHDVPVRPQPTHDVPVRPQPTHDVLRGMYAGDHFRGPVRPKARNQLPNATPYARQKWAVR